MGFFSGVSKLVKKAVSGIKKVVKKVGKAVKKVGKGVLKVVGKVTGALGPVGMIAVGAMAPYALAGMATAGGWVGSAAKAIQAVSGTIAAPFKAAGQIAGKGISKLAGSAGTALTDQGFATLGSKVAQTGSKLGEFLGYQGGSVRDGLGKIGQDVATKWDSAFGTNFSGPKVAYGSPGATGGAMNQKQWESRLTFDEGAAPNMTQAQWEETLAPPDAPKPGQGVASKVLKAGAEAFFGGEPQQPQNGYLPIPTGTTGGVEQSKAERGPLTAVSGAGGQSFRGQEFTGLMATEEFGKRGQSLLDRGLGYA